MSKFDKIIGYSAVKKELKQIADTLKNREVYAKLGVSTPRGLLLYGEPGVGKSLMASAVIEESGRKAFVCRKDQPNGDFVNVIKATFEKAIENAPSIVLLDDMDKFANGDERHPDAEEYVTVQSCIDEAKGKEVFVLATVNNMRCLPRSLHRAGRFDRVIEIDTPRGKDALAIIAHYLKSKKVVDNVDAKTIARIMDGRSCAELETVINEAGLYAGYERAEFITMDHFMEALMRTVFDVPTASDELEDEDFYSSLDGSKKFASQIVYHEAGHAVVSEVLCPESVTLVSAHNRGGRIGGFTDYYNDKAHSPLYWNKSRIVGALGGIAAIEQKYGIFDVGGECDLDQAFDRTKNLIVNTCISGFHLHSYDWYGDDSERLKADQQQAIAAEVEKFYRKAKEIISLNFEFFEKIASALAKKKLLSAVDIQKIKSECKIVPVAL